MPPTKKGTRSLSTPGRKARPRTFTCIGQSGHRCRGASDGGSLQWFFQPKLEVEEAGFFCDGWGIPGVEGDSIKIEGQEPVGILSVDYSTNTLTLNSERSWTPGSRVFYYTSDRFRGSAPDIGAHEFGGTSVVPPPPPPPSRPLPPTLTSPQSGTIGVSPNVTLSWSSSGVVTSYQVQVSRDPGFSTLDINVNTTNGSLALPALTASTTYYWRVNATNQSGTSDWSQVWSLATGAASPQVPASNALVNPGFENSLDAWFSFSNGQADFSTTIRVSTARMLRSSV